MSFHSGYEDGACVVNSLSAAPRRVFAHVMNSSRHSLAHHLAATLGRASLPGRDELAALRPRTRLLMFGLVAWIGLVGLVTVVALASVEMSTIEFPTWFVARASTLAGNELQPKSGFENILQRPVFSRSRQGAAPAQIYVAAPSAPVMLDRGLVLKGVLINGPLAKAFLTSAQNPLGTWVRTSEEIAGWRVVAVKPDQVVLDGRNEQLIIPLSNSSPK
jgi:hypothetical protein